jgi:hypothetical protein
LFPLGIEAALGGTREVRDETGREEEGEQDQDAGPTSGTEREGADHERSGGSAGGEEAKP